MRGNLYTSDSLNTCWLKGSRASSNTTAVRGSGSARSVKYHAISLVSSSLLMTWYAAFASLSGTKASATHFKYIGNASGRFPTNAIRPKRGGIAAGRLSGVHICSLNGCEMSRRSLICS
eukprot:scaffold126661_cov28-Tisochrysis_lutea.AAC.11